MKVVSDDITSTRFFVFLFLFFFFNDTATTEIYTLSLHDALPIYWYYELMREKADISELRPRLLFGQAHLGEAGHSGEINVAEMSDKTEVCGCNGITKGMVVDAITEKGLFTLEDVRLHTKASASCGSCTGLVEQILAATLGGNYTPTPTEQPLCGCSDHTHDEVRQTIREHHLTSIPEAMRFLEWRTPDGCPKCRPALNYYLISTWPGEAVDDPQSREHNERVHANIQQDGTYSVVPRAWGGMTNPQELRAVADCAEKLGVPVKITGGQRLAIPFVKKEDLPGVWAGLGKAGMISGFAYGKAMRSVKSCVGKGLCHFGTQDSLGSASRWKRPSGGPGRRTSSRWASPAVPAIAPNPRSRISVSSAWIPAGNSMSEVPAVLGFVPPTSCARLAATRKSPNTPPPSCSSTGRRDITGSGRRPGSSGWGCPT